MKASHKWWHYVPSAGVAAWHSNSLRFAMWKKVTRRRVIHGQAIRKFLCKKFLICLKRLLKGDIWGHSLQRWELHPKLDRCFLDTFFGHVTSGIWLVWDAYPNICLMYLRYTVLYEYGICICIYIYIYISTPGRVCSWCAAGFPIWNKYKVRIQEEFDEVNLFLDVDVASVRGIAGSNVRTAQLLDIKRDIYVYHVAYGCVSAQKHGSYTWKASCIVTRSFLLETSRLKFNMRVPRRA